MGCSVDLLEIRMLVCLEHFQKTSLRKETGFVAGWPERL